MVPIWEKADHELAHKLEIDQDLEEHKLERRPKRKRSRIDKAKHFIEKTATKVFKKTEKAAEIAIRSTGNFISKIGDKISAEIRAARANGRQIPLLRLLEDRFRPRSPERPQAQPLSECPVIDYVPGSVEDERCTI